MNNISMNNSTLIAALKAGLLIIVVVMVFPWIKQSDVLPVKHIHIEGKFMQLDTHDLQALITDKVSVSFFNIDVTAIRDILIDLPWVSDVSVHRVWPDRLKIIISEQVAFARWENNGFLNTEGYYFSPDKDYFNKHLPLFEGPAESQYIILDRFKFLTQKYGLYVTALRLNERGSWEFELDNSLLVKLGRHDFESRVKQFVYLVMGSLGEELSRAERVDMRYTNGFAVQWQSDLIEDNSEQLDS